MTGQSHDFGLADLKITAQDGTEHSFTVDGGDITIDVDFEDLLNVGLDMEKVSIMNGEVKIHPLTERLTSFEWERWAYIPGYAERETRKQLSPHLKNYFRKVKRKGIEYR